MRVIELDASRWWKVLEFYDDLLNALEAPDWHGRSIDALYDSIIWGGINAIEPPYIVRIRNLSKTREAPREELELFLKHLPEQEREFIEQEERPSGVVFEVEP